MKPNHLFVDTVRFWSMLAIVAIHCIGFLNPFLGVPARLGDALVTPFKFGTIAFFLISGFLLGERLDTCKPLEYLVRRIQKVMLPWLTWFTLFVACLVVADLVHHRLTLTSPLAVSLAIANKMVECAFGTAFWFVPNLILALSVLLVFRRHLHSLRFGALLFAINLLYVFNVYGRWLPSRHTQALLAFVGYLWLGSFAARHFGAIEAWLARVRTELLIVVSLLTATAAFGETQVLTALGSPDPLNTLRLTNQIFSIVVVLLLLKLRHRSWPRFINVRDQTFGIYLAHPLILTIVFNLLKQALGVRTSHTVHYGILVSSTAWIVLSLATYSSCLMLTRWLGHRPLLRWTIGLTPIEHVGLESPRGTSVEGSLLSPTREPRWT